MHHNYAKWPRSSVFISTLNTRQDNLLEKNVGGIFEGFKKFWADINWKDFAWRPNLQNNYFKNPIESISNLRRSSRLKLWKH